PRFHQAVDPVLDGLVLLLAPNLRQGAAHRSGGPAPLAGMRLVNDDGEAAVPVLVPDVIEDEGELLNGCDDDLLAGRYEGSEVTGALGMRHRGADLSELLDGVADLLVE